MFLNAYMFFIFIHLQLCLEQNFRHQNFKNTIVGKFLKIKETIYIN